MKSFLMFKVWATFAVASLVLAGSALGDYDLKIKEVAKELEEIPVLHEGRVKPLQTFARANLLAFQQKTKLRHEDMNAMEWLTELILFPEQAYDRKVFKVRTPEVIESLSIPIDENNNYSFRELSLGLNENLETLQKFAERERDTLDPTERQMLELYFNTIVYLDISRSLTAMVKDVEISDSQLASELGIPIGARVSYFDMLASRSVIADKIQLLQGMSEEDQASGYATAIISLARDLGSKLRDRKSQSLKLMTPAENQMKDLWLSPWIALDDWDQSERTVNKLDSLSEVVRYAQNGDIEDLRASVADFVGFFDGDAKLGMEVSYNNADYFYYSLVFYILSCLLLWVSFAFLPRSLYKASFWAMVAGLALHVVGMTVRCVIMSRPPVTTLYETFIFVGAIAVIAGLILEWATKNSLGLFMGPLIGVVLHFVGIKYAIDDGDSMGMLVAVLDSNFWLATHVTTINIGYGCAGFAGMVAHAYLAVLAFKPKDKARAQEFCKICVGLSYVAVFFTTFGTILGGIWGDQSWGRFWGWDPKENGALLIVLWLLIVMHGRIAGILKGAVYGIGLALTNITVVLAWWGVNLLAVGLHNYGFDEGVAVNLTIFCIIEVVTIAILGTIAKIREVKKPVAARPRLEKVAQDS